MHISSQPYFSLQSSISSTNRSSTKSISGMKIPSILDSDEYYIYSLLYNLNLLYRDMQIQNLYEKGIPNSFYKQHSSSSSMIINPQKMIFLEQQKDHVTQSRDLFWSKVYQFPKYNHAQSLFSSHLYAPSTKCSITAQQSWGKFNPQKQVSFQFDIYRMLKEDRQKQLYRNNGAQEQKNNGQKPELRQVNSMRKIIQIPRPPPFMGAFSHLKTGFNFFNMNASIESDLSYKPFYNLYQQSDCQNSLYQNKDLEVSKISSIQSIKKYQKKQFFEMQSIQSQQYEGNNEEALKDFQIKESRIMNKEDVNRSLSWNQVLQFQSQASFRRDDPMWEEGQSKKYSRQSSMFQINRQQQLKSIHLLQSQLNLMQEMKEVLSDQFVLLQISKMLQNIQSTIFTLDYRKMQWSLELSKFRLQYCFKNSLNHRLKEIFIIANQRSRIDKAIQYIRSRPFRKVYYQLSVQITEILILFQSIILSQTRQCNFIEFLLQADRLKLQISFIYRLLINESYVSQQSRSFEDFDYRYLNSQYLIFKELIRQSKFSDSLNSQIKCLVQTLLKASFEPIISILNNIIFEQCTIIDLNDEIYLKYYFENFKQIGNFISKKIALIKQENNEIYMICKMKEKIQLLHHLTDLEQYENRWQKNYLKKRKLIQRLRKNFKLKIKSEREKKEQQRMKFIYSLKSKFYSQIQEENYKKRQQTLKNRQELEKLKKQINQRQERRKLLEIIEKEKEKGLLLDIQLLQKQKLKREKQRLSKEMNIQQQIKNVTDSIQKIQQEQKSQINEQKANDGQQMMQIQQAKEKIIKSSSQKEKIQSQQQIKSLQSIDSQFAITADHFFMKNKGRSLSMMSNLAKTDSYFKLKSKPTQKMQNIERDESDVSSDQQSSKSIESQQFEPISGKLQLSHDINLTTSLQICINQVIKKQVDIIQQSLHFIIKDKYEILTVINFLKSVFVSGNGQKIQQFIHIAINEHSLLNLKYFSQCLLFDTNIQIIQKLEPSFYHSKFQNRFNTEINIFEENLQNYIGFQFSKIPVILQPYFSYIHLSKYMQIFSFMVRVKYCSNLVSQAWKMLNIYKKQLQLKQREGYEVSDEKRLTKKLYNIRYIINHFLNTFETYMFFKIVEKEFKILKLNISNLHDLEHSHLKMLDNIIKFAFIDNPTQNSSKNFRKNLNLINQFYQIVAQITLDDLPGYKRNETQQKIKFIYLNFKQQNSYIESLIAKLT